MKYDDATFRDDEREAQYFGLLSKLAEKNAQRYEVQTEELLKSRVLNIQFEGANITFKLTPIGCWFCTDDPQGRQNTNSWVRMGWRKSAKRKALPSYFASAEASVIVNRED